VNFQRIKAKKGNKMAACEGKVYHRIKHGQYFVKLSKRQKVYIKIKYFIDAVISAIALIILLPLLLLVCLLQKIDCPHEPIFFVQKRVGLNGKAYNLIKFRTLKSSAPKNVATADMPDPEKYTTRFSRFLRRSSIDELPQLLMVCFTFKMSLVGPRPLVYTEREIRFLRHWYGIYQVRPGITGWAQVNGRDTVSTYDKVRYDREYLQKMSFLFDLKILWKSIFVVLSRAGVVDGKIDENNVDTAKEMVTINEEK